MALSTGWPAPLSQEGDALLHGHLRQLTAVGNKSGPSRELVRRLA